MAETEEKQPKTKGKQGFSKGDPRINRTIPGPGRTHGFKAHLANLAATMLDDKDFVSAAIGTFQEQVKSGNPQAMKLFIESTIMNPALIDRLDETLSGRKKDDTRFMRFTLRDRLHDGQQKVFDTKLPKVLLICGRRWGKTEVLAAKIIDAAISNSVGDVLYIGKTATSAYEIIWSRITEMLTELNVPFTPLLTDQTITLGSGVNIYVRGAPTIPDIDKLRGHAYRLAVVDEIQSIKHLRLLVNEILLPAMADYDNSQMLLAGTPPRIKGTYVEQLWEGSGKYISKHTGDLSDNPFIPNREKVLDQVREENGYSVENPVYQREWLGKMGVYDLDALVFQTTIKNNFHHDELRVWIEGHRPQDLLWSSGLDLGWSDSDAFVIVLASRVRPEKWLVFEHKQAKNDITALARKIEEGFNYVRTHAVLRNIPGFEEMKIWTDTGGGGKKIAVELRNQFSLNTVSAIKTEKSLAIDLLRDEVRTGRMKYDLEGPWADETQKVIFERDEADKITSIIDDSYHPDFLDALLYAFRWIWRVSGAKLGAEMPDSAPSDPAALQSWQQIQGQTIVKAPLIKPRDYLDERFQETDEDE